MSHRIQSVTAKEKFIIEATFFGGEKVQYDMKQLFSVFPQFQLFQTEKSFLECKMNKNKDVIVVEGQSDVNKLRLLIDADYVITNGSEISRETIEYIKTLSLNINKKGEDN